MVYKSAYKVHESFSFKMLLEMFPLIYIFFVLYSIYILYIFCIKVKHFYCYSMWVYLSTGDERDSWFPHRWPSSLTLSAVQKTFIS